MKRLILTWAEPCDVGRVKCGFGELAFRLGATIIEAGLRGGGTSLDRYMTCLITLNRIINGHTRYRIHRDRLASRLWKYEDHISTVLQGPTHWERNATDSRDSPCLSLSWFDRSKLARPDRNVDGIWKPSSPVIPPTRQMMQNQHTRRQSQHQSQSRSAFHQR